MVLEVASVWDRGKVLDEFVKLCKKLPENYLLILVGLYCMAHVFVNPILEDNFPTTNLEALACGIPVFEYPTGGSTEAIDDKAGFVVEYQNVDMFTEKIIEVCERGPFSASDCRQRAMSLYERSIAFKNISNSITILSHHAPLDNLPSPLLEK